MTLTSVAEHFAVAVTTYFTDFGLSWLGFKQPSYCMRGAVLTDCATATELINSKTSEDALVFTYLGIKVATTGDCDKDTNTRISRANQTFAIWSPSPR